MSDVYQSYDERPPFTFHRDRNTRPQIYQDMIRRTLDDFHDWDWHINEASKKLFGKRKALGCTIKTLGNGSAGEEGWMIHFYMDFHSKNTDPWKKSSVYNKPNPYRVLLAEETKRYQKDVYDPPLNDEFRDHFSKTYHQAYQNIEAYTEKGLQTLEEFVHSKNHNNKGDGYDMG